MADLSGEAAGLWNGYQGLFQRFTAPWLAAMPFGPTRDLEEQGRRMLRAWLELSEAGVEFQTLVARTWGRVG
jgi:hypothetical protein